MMGAPIAMASTAAETSLLAFIGILPPTESAAVLDREFACGYDRPVGAEVDAELGIAVLSLRHVIVPAGSGCAAIVEDLGGAAKDPLDFGRAHADRDGGF